MLGIGGRLSVGRIWPRPRGRLSLELRTEDGAVLAGQWIADVADRERIVRGTRAHAAHPGHVVVGQARGSGGGDAGSVVIQARGADRRLRALPRLLADGPNALLLHRPERRAVVYRPDAAGGEYLRILRPGRTADVVRVAEIAGALVADLPGVTVPDVRMHVAQDGLVVTSGLPGRSLREVGAAGERSAAGGALRVGTLLRELGRLTAPGGLPVRAADAELAWLGTWLDRVAHHLPQVHGRLAPVLDAVAEHLARSPASPPVVVHGDLHDGQVLVADDGGVAVLDWDTLAVGEGALDAGNVWAHAELRTILGQWSGGTAADIWGALVETWAPSRAELDRAAAYRRLVLLRLACQYAFRPAHAHAVDPLVQLAGAP